METTTINIDNLPEIAHPLDNNVVVNETIENQCQKCGQPCEQAYCQECFETKGSRIRQCKECGELFELQPFKSKPVCEKCHERLDALAKQVECVECKSVFVPFKGQRKMICSVCRDKQEVTSTAQPVEFVCEICGNTHMKPNKRHRDVCDNCKVIEHTLNNINPTNLKDILLHLSEMVYKIHGESLMVTRKDIRSALYSAASRFKSDEE